MGGWVVVFPFVPGLGVSIHISDDHSHTLITSVTHSEFGFMLFSAGSMPVISDDFLYNGFMPLVISDDHLLLQWLYAAVTR